MNSKAKQLIENELSEAQTFNYELEFPNVKKAQAFVADAEDEEFDVSSVQKNERGIAIVLYNAANRGEKWKVLAIAKKYGAQ